MENNRPLEEDSCEFYRHLSLRLYDVLDRVGASTEFRTFRQDCCISREILWTTSSQLMYPKQTILAQYIFGSSSEGTTIPSLNSDLDVLHCIDTPVVANISETQNGHALLMIRDRDTRPGYVKLQYVFNRQPETVNTRDKDRDTEECDSEGRICLKHVVEIGMDKHADARNGPADTNTDGNIDHVMGYRCSTIPEFALKWIVRDRQYKWPSKRMLDKMACVGSFVVGVGHPASHENNIEWRLSFSLQEREMMFSMNMVQYKCYVVLKLIKKDLIEPVIGKSISSYHLKTCMFHAIENTNLNIWKRENLCQCVLLCLTVLLKWVYIGNCPNYFITDENMFDRDIHRRQRLNLLQQLRSLLSHGCGFLFLIKLDQIGDFLKTGRSNVHIESMLTDTLLSVILKTVNSVMILRRELCRKADTRANDSYFTSMILKYITWTKLIKDHNEQQIEKAFSYIQPYIHLRLAQSYATLSFNTNVEDDTCALLQKSGYHLRQGYHCDLTSTILLEATVIFKLKQYERCVCILDQLETIFIQNPPTICKCYFRTCFYSNEQEKQINTLPVSEIVGRMSTCMIFHRSELSITPEALRYEMFRSFDTPPGSREEYGDAWFDMAVVDAEVYLHFMQYLVYTKLNNHIHKHIAINKLELVLTSENKLGHLETAYNLLGWIYFQENWIEHGIKYFQKSWTIRPDHNAAKIHILKLISDSNLQRSSNRGIIRRTLRYYWKASRRRIVSCYRSIYCFTPLYRQSLRYLWRICRRRLVCCR